MAYSKSGSRPWRPDRFRSLLIGLLLGLIPATGAAEVAPTKIAVSIAPQVWLIEQIGGGRVEVSSLLAPGDSPATFQPTDSQITDLLRSRLFFRIGVPFETAGWLEGLVASKRVGIIDTREGLELRPIDSSRSTNLSRRADSDNPGAAGGLDPHIWLSPNLLQIQARTVARWLQEVDPASRDWYRRQLLNLDNRLVELHRDLESQLAPYRDRAFMTFHPSWGYFAHDYGLNQLAIEIEGKEPTDEELTRLQKMAR